jgi:riboflavin kinase / FMN adenylyltransferase
MHIIRQLADLPTAAHNGAVSIGNFDGVHRGHAAIVRRLLERAEEVGGPAVVFTFDPHPVRLLRPDQCPPPLTWTERKAQLLAGLGVDWIVAYPTDEALLNLSAQEFFDRIVRGALAAGAVVEGPNFYFGHNREGTIDRLRALAAAANITLDIVPSVEMDGEIVSSSRVRALIAAGHVDKAAKLLGMPYRIRGMVTHGAGRGAKIGFPTANLAAIDTLLPAEGVYAGRAWAEGQSWAAAMNLGPSPTFHDANVRIEVHLFGRSEPLYGQPLEVDFLARLRDIRPFPSVESLTKQIIDDVEQTKRIAASQPPIPSP